MAPRPCRWQRHRRRPRRRPPTRHAAPRRRDPRQRRRRYAGARPAPARDRLPPWRHHRARRHRSARRGPAGEGRDALGGRGLRGPGVAGRGHGARRGRRAARRDRRFRAQGQYRQQPPPARRARPDPAPHDVAVRRARGGRRRGRPIAWSRRSGAPRRSRCPRPGGDPRRPAVARDLPGPPGHRPRGGRRNATAQVRPSRREPSRSRPRHGAGPGHRAEPRGPGRCRPPAAQLRLSGEPGQPQRRLGRGPPARRASDRNGPVPPGRGPGSARRAGGVRPVRCSRSRGKPAGAGTTDVPAERSGPPGSVLILGSGPVVIGQAAEFDYAGTQACRALRAEGVRTILVNSNPATIMTDPQVADAVYLEPLTVEAVAAVIERERPDGLLAGLGGQTALNLATALAREGVLERFGVRLLGTPLAAIEMAEDRLRFRDLLDRLGQPYAPSAIVAGATAPERLASADAALAAIGLPAIVRPAYTLGGTGGGIVGTEAAYRERIRAGLRASPIGQVMVERCLVGWQEIEYEVMRDGDDTCIAVCSMENFDPLGIHTGDSIVVAPVQTLTDAVHQRLRSAALAIIRALGVEGGCNVQFALSPDSSEYAVIEVNPRVSRSSALASKATGYPIARVAAQIAIGRRLAEIPNAITGTTVAAFEPALDYVVVKLPRFPFDKFPRADRSLGSQMKATGEVMAIDRTFGAALNKALRGLEQAAGRGLAREPDWAPTLAYLGAADRGGA